jgi:hypothetical protein
LDFRDRALNVLNPLLPISRHFKEYELNP